jgi:hypothetical protein
MVGLMLGIVIAFPLFSMSYYTMVRTSTPEFCASCHEIKPAVVAWRSSTHTNNAAGRRGGLHGLPPARAPGYLRLLLFQKLPRHQRRGGPFFGRAYDREKAREAAYAAFDNDQCQKCHRNLLHMPTSGAPCWPTARWCMPGKDMKKNASTVIMTWFTRSAAWSCFARRAMSPTRPKGLQTTVVF